jgi:hypothetical protein
MWASGLEGGLKKDRYFLNYFTLVVSCGLTGGSQIVGQKDPVLHRMWCCCKAMWVSGLVGGFERDR